MTQRNDKNGGPQPEGRTVKTTEQSTNSDGKAGNHEYDPGGMAGQKAGIVEEIEREAAASDVKGAKADKSPNNEPTSAK